MPALLRVVLTAMHLSLTAHAVPERYVEPSCRAAADTMIRKGRRDPHACLQDERQARAKLKKEWTTFSQAERTRCRELTTTGGPPSYVELLTCLQMAKDARKLPPGGRLQRSLEQ